ncbi:hypothetical protein WJX73_005616 [Symbiochloris irregularis]|uniref:Rubisco LSMT substrate-binding domain-containing protein n=1 Tax=Symbiochloris irregularis TaxID=706552 RepID=A0AAW1P1I9_9CHLO
MLQASRRSLLQQRLAPAVLRRHPITQLVAASRCSAKTLSQLALFLLYERQQGQSSAWQGYVSSLPVHVDTPLSWTEEELAPLQGSQLYANLQGYRDFFKDLHERLSASLFQQHQVHFAAEAFSFDKFIWAVQTVRSRVHSPLEGKSIALVPLADLVKHRRAGKSRWKVQSGLFGGSQAVTVDAVSPLEAGEFLAMDFGPDKLDSSLLLDYGVLDASSPQAGFLLSLGLPEQDRFFDDKADVLDLNGLAESWQFTLRPSQKPSSDLMAFLRLLNLTGPDSFLLEALFRNEAWGHLSLPVSEENEAAVCRSMLDGCTEALQGYVSSIDEDLAALRNEGLPPRAAKAVQVCLGEKESLEYTLQWFETHYKSLDKLEYYQERRLKGLGLMDDAGRNTWDDLEDGIA